MTAIQHDMRYNLTLKLKSEDCGHNPMQLIRELDNLKHVVRFQKNCGDHCGEFDIQLPKEVTDNSLYPLKFAAKALISGSALMNVYIYTNDDSMGSAWLHEIINALECDSGWICTVVSSMRLKTVQFVLD